MIHFRCPSCDEAYSVDPELAGQKIRCRQCRSRVAIPGKDLRASPTQSRPANRKNLAPAVRESPLAQAWPYVSHPLIVSIFWLGFGLLLALAAPGFAHWPWVMGEIAQHLPLFVTGALIVWNLVRAWKRMVQTGRTLSAFPFALAQVALFTLLFFQVACHLGAHHFAWGQGNPGWWHWPLFGLAHAVRATDLVDGIEAYGVSVQTIHHAGLFMSTLLILFHLILDLFVIRLVMQVVGRLKVGFFREGYFNQYDSVDWRITFLLIAALVGLVVAWLVMAIAVRPWRTVDFILWPLDNLLHVVDFTDALTLYHVQLHQVPQGPFESTMTFLCRVGIALLIANLLNRCRLLVALRWLGGLHLSREQLEEVAKKHKSREYRRLAKNRLRELEEELPPQEDRFWRELRPCLGTAAAMSILLGLAGILFLGDWEKRREEFVAAACAPDHAEAAGACRGLARMGRLAEHHSPQLLLALPLLPPAQQRHVLDALAAMGPEIARPLEPFFSDKSLTLAEQVQWLKEGKSYQDLILQSSQLEIERLRVLDSIRNNEDQQGDADQIKSLHRGLQGVEGRIALTRRKIPEGMLVPILLQLVTGAPGRADRLGALQELQQLGQRTQPAIPTLLLCLQDSDAMVQVAAAHALAGLPHDSPLPREILIPLLRNPHENLLVRGKAAEVLGELGPAKTIVPLLREYLRDGPELVVRGAVKGLGNLKEGARDAVPDLITRFVTANKYVEWQTRRESLTELVTALKHIGPAASPAAPYLTEIMEEHLVEGYGAKEALLAMGKEAVPHLAQWLLKVGPTTRTRLAKALGFFGPDAAPAVPTLIGCLELNLRTSEEEVAWTSAVETLGKIGPAARAAIPYLLKAPTTSKWFVTPPSAIAQAALFKIDPKWESRVQQ